MLPLESPEYRSHTKEIINSLLGTIASHDAYIDINIYKTAVAKIMNQCKPIHSVLLSIVLKKVKKKIK